MLYLLYISAPPSVCCQLLSRSETRDCGESIQSAMIIHSSFSFATSSSLRDTESSASTAPVHRKVRVHCFDVSQHALRSLGLFTACTSPQQLTTSRTSFAICLLRYPSGSHGGYLGGGYDVMSSSVLALLRGRDDATIRASHLRVSQRYTRVRKLLCSNSFR